MGNISFLTGTSNSGSRSIDESIYELESSSMLFQAAWSRVPPDLARAAKVSAKAMEHLDHIVNEILRARDTKMGKGIYTGSNLESTLSIMRGFMTSPVTAHQQSSMIAAGPGQGNLPGQPVQITLDRLLNKIKHRHHQSANFRIVADRHIFVINVDKMNKTPDSIVEFDVAEFCEHCRDAAQHL
jgi:hypothetical protein